MRLNVMVFFVPTFEPEGKTTVLMVRGFVDEPLGAAEYDAWMSWTTMSLTCILLVLNLLLRPAPWKAAPERPVRFGQYAMGFDNSPRTAASSALTFRAIFSLGCTG